MRVFTWLSAAERTASVFMSRQTATKIRLINMTNDNPIASLTPEQAYIRGVEWRDEHPSLETVLKVLDLYNKHKNEPFDEALDNIMKELNHD